MDVLCTGEQGVVLDVRQKYRIAKTTFRYGNFHCSRQTDDFEPGKWG